MARDKKVVILGGGVAGLAAAHELRRLAPGTSLCLLEARQQLGGRVFTAHDPQTAEPLELGAEFVHGRPPELLSALREAGIGLTHDGDDNGGEDSPFALLPKLLAPLLRGDTPDVTIGAYFAKQRLPVHQVQMLRGFVQGFYVAPPDRASARAIARMEVAASAIGGEGGAQLPGGYEALVHWLARAFHPGEVRLGTAATALSWRAGGVRVRARSLAGGRLPELAADAAIVALPFPALAGGPGALALRPALPAKRRAAASLRMGHATKVFLRFDGSLETGSFFFGGGAIPVWWSAAAPQTNWLVGWAGGANAEKLDRRSDEAILEAALDSIAKPTGHSRAALARAVTGFRCQRWSREPFIEGAYAWVPLGADGAMAALAAPVSGTLFFAGEATHAEHAGTVHGAFESGLRAARELLDA